MIKRLLRSQPHLVFYNYANISDRLLEATDSDLFVAFNKKRNVFQVHSINKFRFNPHKRSVIGSDLSQKDLTGWLVTDVKARDMRRFNKEILSEEAYIDSIISEHEQKIAGMFVDKGIQEVRQMLGGL